MSTIRILGRLIEHALNGSKHVARVAMLVDAPEMFIFRIIAVDGTEYSLRLTRKAP